MFYIMQTGMTPFSCPSPYLAFLKIKREGCLRRPMGIVEDEAWDLIQQLMRHDPTQRIGASGFVFPTADSPNSKIVEHDVTGGDGRAYNVLRNHPYFAVIRDNASSNPMTTTVLPSLRDLCIRPLAQAIHHDAWNYVALLDEHPPGDGSPRYDCLQLSKEDRRAVMHVLDRCQWLREPRVYVRFFSDPVDARLNKIRFDTHDVVGLTQMNDDQGKAPKATLHDPYGTLAVNLPHIIVYHLIHPWFMAESFDDSVDAPTLKHQTKLLKKSIACINKDRPHLVIVTSASSFSEKARKWLAKISESIPVVVQDNRTTFVQAWRLGVQCLVLQSIPNDDDAREQLRWIREHMEQCRLSKHPLIAFVNGDPREMPLGVVKRLARGRTLLLSGLTKDSFATQIHYHANELIPRNSHAADVGEADDAESLRSVDSDEEDESRDSFTMHMHGHGQAGVLSIKIDTEQPDTWDCAFRDVHSDD